MYNIVMFCVFMVAIISLCIVIVLVHYFNYKKTLADKAAKKEEVRYYVEETFVVLEE